MERYVRSIIPSRVFPGQRWHMVQPRIKISLNMDKSLLGFYEYIGNIGGCFYINISKSKNIKNILKLIKILLKSRKMT